MGDRPCGILAADQLTKGSNLNAEKADVPAPRFLPDVPTTSIVLLGTGSTVFLTRGSKWRATFSHSGEQNHRFSGSRAVASVM